ncbi:MAG: hypothetical protein U0744_15225 [Gemmataceae bacterium]
MLPLYRDPHYFFRFDDARIISRVHLEGAKPGLTVKLVRVDPRSMKEGDVIAHAVVEAEGWVEFSPPILVRAGEAFLAIPDGER